MRKALILGIKGQDGSLLSKFLLQKNYKVTGVSRTKFNNKNLTKLKVRKNLKIHCFDYCDKNKMQNLLIKEILMKYIFLQDNRYPLFQISFHQIL